MDKTQTKALRAAPTLRTARVGTAMPVARPDALALVPGEVAQ